MRGVLPPDVIRVMTNDWTAPFWDAAAQHRLVVPRCVDCGAHRLPPTPFCWRCRAQEMAWEEHAGSGSIYSFTVVRHAVIPDVRDALPVIAAVIALDGVDDARLVSNIVDADPADVRIGQPVTLDWYDVRDGEAVPVFRIAG